MKAVIGGIGLEVSDDDLCVLSARNPGWRFERADDGSLLLSPTSTSGGAKSGEAFAQLYAYAKRAGGTAFDASTGFKTPAGGVVSPDASWVREERVVRNRADAGFWPLLPDVVIEVASRTDSRATVIAKVDALFADGAAYAVAVDPTTRAVYELGTAPAGLTLDIDAIIDA